MVQPAATSRYVILFTPRSGSGWLSGIVEQCGQLGRAKEVFNPNFCRKHADKLGIPSLDTYAEMVARRDNRGGVFSLEVTAYQIRRVFDDEALSFTRFAKDPFFWLIREDIVAQAVSLAKMVTTRVGQSVAATNEARAAAEEAFCYDAKLIKKLLKRIHDMEQLTERWIAEWELAPLRMSYERITRLTPHQMLNVIARHASLPDVRPVDIQPHHEKLGTSRNVEFAERFRQEEAEWLAPVEVARAALKAKLNDL
jgi:LPS sulfotransferase NodH